MSAVFFRRGRSAAAGRRASLLVQLRLLLRLVLLLLRRGSRGSRRSGRSGWRSGLFGRSGRLRRRSSRGSRSCRRSGRCRRGLGRFLAACSQHDSQRRSQQQRLLHSRSLSRSDLSPIVPPGRASAARSIPTFDYRKRTQRDYLCACQLAVRLGFDRRQRPSVVAETAGNDDAQISRKRPRMASASVWSCTPDPPRKNCATGRRT